MLTTLLTALQEPSTETNYVDGPRQYVGLQPLPVPSHWSRPAAALRARALVLTSICSCAGLAAAQSPTVSPLKIVAVDTANGFITREPSVALAGPSLGMCVYNDGGTHYSLWDGTEWTQLAYSHTGGDPSVVYDAVTNRFVSCTFRGGSVEGGVWLEWFDVGSGTFLGPLRIVDDPPVDKPWLVLGELQGSNQEFYLSYSKVNFPTSAGYYGRSTDSGSTWVTGPALGAGFCLQTSVASPGNGPVYLTYPASGGLGMAVGTDLPGGGVQFSALTDSVGANVVVPTTGVSPMGGEIPGPSPAKRVPYVTADPSNPNRVYLVYFDNPAAQYDVDVLCARLDRDPANGAWSLSQQVRVNDDQLESDDKDQFQPAAVVDDVGRVHVTFYDDRNYDQPDTASEPLFDAYYAYSTDGGTTFTNIRLNRATDDAVIDFGFPGIDNLMPGEYPGIAYAGDTIVLTLAGTWRQSPSANKSVIWGTVITF